MTIDLCQEHLEDLIDVGGLDAYARDECTHPYVESDYFQPEGWGLCSYCGIEAPQNQMEMT
jgi:hypothetical protein